MKIGHASVYLINGMFFIHGISILLPWNLFITNQKYFMDFRLNNSNAEDENYKTYFLNYLGISSFFISLLFQFINLFLFNKFGSNDKVKVVSMLSTMILMVFLITLMLFIEMSSSIFFFITMTIVAITSLANGIYQNSLYGLVAMFPGKGVICVHLGSFVSGVLISIFAIISFKVNSNSKFSALIYFLSSLSILIFALVYFLIISKTASFKIHVGHQIPAKSAHETITLSVANQSNSVECKSNFTMYQEVFKMSKFDLLSLFFTMVTSLSCFPAVMNMYKNRSSYFMFEGPIFSLLFCFLSFNLFMLLGCLLTFSMFNARGSTKCLMLMSICRISSLVIFILLNSKVLDKIASVIVDILFIIVVAITALTHGYLTSILFSKIPRDAIESTKKHAGMFSGFVAILGIFTGMLISFGIVWLNKQGIETKSLNNASNTTTIMI